MGRLTGTSIYLDTNTLIHFVENDNWVLRTGLERAYADGCRIVTSELTLAEVLVKPLRDGDDRTAAIYDGLLSSGLLLRSIAVDRTIWRKSAELRAQLGGKLPDTVHIATAMLEGCRVMISSDKRLRLPPDIRLLALDEIATLADILS